MDCGLAINPGIVESQIVGMSVHGTSLALKEEVQFNQTNVTSLDWNSYQTLRFGEHPAVTPIVVQQINEKSSGAGEEVLPAVVAAIGNAFFDADGRQTSPIPADTAAGSGSAQYLHRPDRAGQHRACGIAERARKMKRAPNLSGARFSFSLGQRATANEPKE